MLRIHRRHEVESPEVRNLVIASFLARRKFDRLGRQVLVGYLAEQVVYHIEAGVAMLFQLAHSPLWRIREAAAMGLQRILARKWASTIHRLQRMALDIGPYEWRALVAGVAEPSLLTERTAALDALDPSAGEPYDPVAG